MAGSITGATAAYALAVESLFASPQLLQGFAADDVFSTPAIQSAEVLMGVDGIMSAGFVFKEIEQEITLQADSDSGILFDDWWAAQQAAEDIYFANATVTLRAIGRKWNMTRGVLTSYAPIPDAKKLLQPRKFRITWQNMSPAPV